MRPHELPNCEACPACGNWRVKGVDCCGNGKQSNSKLSPIHDSTPARIDAGEARQNAPASTQTAKERAPRKRTKAEMMALDKAIRDNPGAEVIEQPIKLKLTGGGTYTPDLMIRTKWERMILIEVKGGYKGPGWEQGIERFKRARYEWSYWFEFQLCAWNSKNQTWRVE